MHVLLALALLLDIEWPPTRCPAPTLSSVALRASEAEVLSHLGPALHEYTRDEDDVFWGSVRRRTLEYPGVTIHFLGSHDTPFFVEDIHFRAASWSLSNGLRVNQRYADVIAMLGDPESERIGDDPDTTVLAYYFGISLERLEVTLRNDVVVHVRLFLSFPC